MREVPSHAGEHVTQKLRDLHPALGERYAVERLVGQGGMARVFLAIDRKHGREVALKVLHPEFSSAGFVDRFLREIAIAARLSHPNILPLFDSGQVDGLLFYVMPYVDGDSLAVRLRREKQLTIEDTVSITQALAAALDFAHARGVVHRDLKPENILFHHDRPMLADFGIALAVSDAVTDRLTETGVMLGTPAYMSPEQASGDSVLDARSDIYSLACVVYEMLAGQPPFVAPNLRALMARHVTDPVPPLTTVRPSVSDAMAAAVDKALAKVPMDRFGAAGEFAAALERGRRGKRFEDARSLLVLPFAAVGNALDIEHFADGLTDEVIADVSRIAGVQVVSRGSAMKLKGSPKDLRTIARELHVRYVVEGSVRRVRESLRVTVQLVDAARDTPLWTEKFSGPVDDPLAMQESVSRAVGRALPAQLGTPVASTAHPVAGDPRAYECYLRAQRDIARFTEPAIINALQYLQEALEIIGDNVLLYYAIAEAYFVFPYIAGKEPEACLERAADCATRILGLDPAAPLGHCIAGLVEWQRAALNGDGLTHLQHAYALDPSHARVLHWLGLVASRAGLDSIAEECTRRLLQADPLGALGHRHQAWLHLLEGERDQAVRSIEKAVESDSAGPEDRWLRAYAHAAVGDRDRAVVLIDDITKDAPNNVWAWLARLYRHGLTNERRKALRALTPALKRAARIDGAYSFLMAECFTLIGEPMQALEWLDNGVRRGFANARFLSEHAPFLGPLRNEPRFPELLNLAERFRS